MREAVRLYDSDEIYRPFWERNSLFLEVTKGCSWRRCKFCYFADKPFAVLALEEIEEKARKLGAYAEGKHRIFLLDENPFVVDAVKLLAVFDIIHRELPGIQEISMYARADDVLRKSVQELCLLRKQGLCHLHIGLESGSDKVLELTEKGITSGQMIRACEMLRESGIDFSFTIISGLGGREYSQDHVRGTAEVINRTQPAAVWSMGLLLWEGTPLEKMWKSGRFQPLTAKERLQEVCELVEELELEESIFADTTILGKYTVMGRFPEQKESLIGHLRELLRKEK